MRHFVDEKYPGRVLLCEANQWPGDVRKYLGDGDEFQLAFQFPLMPRIYIALGKADSTPIRWALEQTPTIPDNCQWGTFLRNHDELTLEMVSEEERQWLWKEYAPDQAMRLNLGIRRRLAPLLENDPRKILLAYSLLLTLPGTPVLYYGDEIGMGDNVSLADRDGLRTPMQWDAKENCGFSTSATLYAPVIRSSEYSPRRVNVAASQENPDSIWQAIRKMISLRKSHSVFGEGSFTMAAEAPASLAAYFRKDGSETLLILNNLSAETTWVTMSLPADAQGKYLDLLTNQVFEHAEGKITLTLQPYQYSWLRLNNN
jgi:maltose alpha-D-glucosyltransferase/alpha-amylase